MGRRNSGRKLDCEELCWYLDCRYVPHGCYAFTPTLLCSMAFLCILVQDGCDHSRMTGGNVSEITGSDVIPFLETGISAYRSPMYYPTEGEWKMVFTESCKSYPPGQLGATWGAARWLTWLGAVFGGAVTFFLWFSICFTFSQRTWLFCAAQSAFAGILRAGTFLISASRLCRSNETDCIRGFGAKMDIAAIILFTLGALSIFCHYPDPRVRQVPEYDLSHQQVAEAESLRPKRLSHSRQQSPAVPPGYEGDDQDYGDESYYDPPHSQSHA